MFHDDLSAPLLRADPRVDQSDSVDATVLLSVEQDPGGRFALAEENHFVHLRLLRGQGVDRGTNVGPGVLITKVTAATIAHSPQVEPEYGIASGRKPSRQRHELSVR